MHGAKGIREGVMEEVAFEVSLKLWGVRVFQEEKDAERKRRIHH